MGVGGGAGGRVGGWRHKYKLRGGGGERERQQLRTQKGQDLNPTLWRKVPFEL